MSLKDGADVYVKYASGDNTDPDVANANFVRLFTVNVRETFSKEIDFEPEDRDYGEHFLGPLTLAEDELKTSLTFEATGRTLSGKSNLFSLPSGIRDGNDDGDIRFEDISFTTPSFLGSTGGYDTYVLLGAPKIKNFDYSITAVDTGSDQFTISGDKTNYFVANKVFQVRNSTGNDANYTVSSSSYSSGSDETTITVKQNVGDSTADGSIKGSEVFRERADNSVSSVSTGSDQVSVSGDQTSDFDTGDRFQIRGSTGNDGDYTVSSASYDSNDDETDITVEESIDDSTADGTTEIGSDTLLDEGTDYEMDYRLGRVKLLNTGSTNKDNQHVIDYTFAGDPHNVGAVLRRMAQMGGAVVVETDRTGYTELSGNSDTGRKYTCQLTNVEINRVPDRPDRSEVTIEARKAKDDS